jgi:capsular exopolysaccharide synthesis family protein
MVADTKDYALVTRFPLEAPFQQAFEQLTASLLLLDDKQGAGLQAVCVMATHSGYGASTTALNLAITVAAAGRRTLLIDANLRKPSLHEPFDFPQSPGLAEILLKKATLKDAVRATRTSNFYMLPAGTSTGSPQPLLQAANLAPVFEWVKSNYDFAIVDTAPALRFPDGLQVAKFTSGVVLVLPADGAPRRAEIEVRRRLERADLTVLGIVINRTSLKRATNGY